MKAYGANKATEFTKKQIGVIYRAAKTGELKVEKWAMSLMYDLADYYGHDDNAQVARDEQTILQILEYVFAGENEKAQARIDWFTKTSFEAYSSKRQATLNRELVA